MDTRQKVLLENILITKISVFHDIDDTERREEYVRKCFFEFCEEYDVDQNEAFEIVEKYFQADRRVTRTTPYYYTDLRSIIFPSDSKKDFKQSIQVKDLETNTTSNSDQSNNNEQELDER